MMRMRDEMKNFIYISMLFIICIVAMHCITKYHTLKMVERIKVQSYERELAAVNEKVECFQVNMSLQGTIDKVAALYEEQRDLNVIQSKGILLMMDEIGKGE
jgi:hypothetical protein